MDTSVALVQAYLNVNGYFTVAEHPVLEAFHADEARIVTDLDILAVRFAGARHQIIRGKRAPSHIAFAPDPMLRCPGDSPDMIVGEVKEGRARFNSAASNPAVLKVALTRFGCCHADHVEEVTRHLLERGHARTPNGHAIRMIAFGDASDERTGTAHTIVPMRHVVEFLRAYLNTHWAVLRHAHFDDTVLGVLALMEKWKVEALGSAAHSPVVA